MRARLNFWRRRRHDERVRQRRPQRHLRDQIAPSLPFLWRQLRPALGIFQKFRAFRRTHARKFGEGANALGALRRRQFVKGLQRFFHLRALGVGQRVERFLFFDRRQFKKLVELVRDPAPVVFRQCIPARLIVGIRLRTPGRWWNPRARSNAACLRCPKTPAATTAAKCSSPRAGFEPARANPPAPAPAARAGLSAIRAAAASDTSAIPSRAGAARVRPVRARGIRGPWRGFARGFPAGGWSE